MESREGKKWERYEFVLALSLYFRLPFGKMSPRNPEIIKLANIMRRSNNSVCLRLVNFASLDPILQARNIKGMQAGMKSCKPYWDEFYNNKEKLFIESENILAKLQGLTLEQKYKPILKDTEILIGEEKISAIHTRVNQNIFRKMILSIYDTRCALTNIDIPDLLLASHIKPWAKDKENRLNPLNGICLSALYDRAFDQGLIGFDQNYKTILSKEIKNNCNKTYYEQYFKIIKNRTLQIPYIEYAPSKDFLEWHMDCIFRR